jgi:hypothetical protein
MEAASAGVNLATPNARKKKATLYRAIAWPADKVHFCEIEIIDTLLCARARALNRQKLTLYGCRTGCDEIDRCGGWPVPLDPKR